MALFLTRWFIWEWRIHSDAIFTFQNHLQPKHNMAPRIRFSPGNIVILLTCRIGYPSAVHNLRSTDKNVVNMMTPSLMLRRRLTSVETMMTSSNGNIFRVTGPLCGEFTGPGEFHAQRPVTRSFDVFFELPPNQRLSKQPWGWWFETPSWSLWRQCNDITTISFHNGVWSRPS